MNADVGDLINLYRFPTGRRIFCFRKTQEVILESETDLRQRLIAAEAHDMETRLLEIQWMQKDKTAASHDPQAASLDAQVDRALSGFDSTLAAQIQIYNPGSVEHDAAAAIRNSVLPQGVGRVTSLTYIEQHATVKVILEKLSGELAAPINALSLGPMVRRIAQLNNSYGATLGRSDEGLSYDQIRAADQQGQRHLLQIVAWVIGHHPDDTDEDVAHRNRLLAAIIEQNSAIRKHRRTRRRTIDIDPDTGLEETSPNTLPPPPGSSMPPSS